MNADIAEKTKALEEVRNQAVEIAIAATGKILRDSIDDTKAAALVQQSIAELKQKIH